MLMLLLALVQLLCSAVLLLWSARTLFIAAKRWCCSTTHTYVGQEGDRSYADSACKVLAHGAQSSGIQATLDSNVLPVSLPTA